MRDGEWRWLAALASLAAGVAAAQESPVPPSAVPAPAAATETDLAKKLANPVADLISVPFQFNYNRGIGPEGDGRQMLLNIQPVVPISLTEEWNVISRTILPVIWGEDFFPGMGSQWGLGDTTQSLFLSPQKPGPGGLIWGLGPVFLLPTATEDYFGGDQWGAGPTAVALVQKNGWTVGGLANQIWSFAGDGDREDVNATYLQPFLAYTFPTATTLTINTETTYDWEADEASVPINLQAAQILKLGGLPVQFQAGARYYAASTEGGADGWGARFSVVFLFPR